MCLPRLVTRFRNGLQDKVQRAKEPRPVANRAITKIFRQYVFNQFAELPQITIGHDAVNREERITVDALHRHQLGQALAPTLLEIVFLGFRDNDQRRFQHGFAERRFGGDDVIRRPAEVGVTGDVTLHKQGVALGVMLISFAQHRKDDDFGARAFGTEQSRLARLNSNSAINCADGASSCAGMKSSSLYLILNCVCA
jgi:hypothetical protein